MRQAINPYNFAPFYSDDKGGVEPPSRKPLDAYYPEPSELRSGWIDVKLTAKTALIIPDGSRYEKIPVAPPDRPGVPAVTDEKRFLKQYRFFRLPNGQCAIPGSSLRGMLRAMYEAASNSCLPFLLKDHAISQRTPLYAAFKNRGLLEYDSTKRCWRLLKVKKHRIPVTGEAVRTGVFQWSGETYKTAQKVRFTLTEDGVSLGQGASEGVLQFNVPVDREANYNVMVLEPVGVEYEWENERESEEAFRSIHGSVFDTVRNVKRNFSAQRDLQDALERARRGEGALVPVYWFRVERDGKPLYYLSGAAAGRVQQRRKWAEIMGAHSPCETLDFPTEAKRERDEKEGRKLRYGLCPACALFGTVADGGTRGRLRFTDAVAVAEPELSLHTLQILGEPRSSSFEFYLRKPDPEAIYWNYDFYGVRHTEKNPWGKTVEWTEYRDLPQATPRGRKFYWHSQPARDWDDELDKDKRKDMSASMEAAAAGAEFTFRIYFDRITETQLQDMLWLVALGDNQADSPLQYKLGHAKPLGYGSVKLTATECVVRAVRSDFSMTKETREIPEKPSCSFPLDNITLRSLLRLCDARAAAGQDVEYLTGMDYISRERREKPIIYAWFRENRVRADSLRTLPEPLDADLRLPTEMRGTRKGGEGGRAYRSFGQTDASSGQGRDGGRNQGRENRRGETSGRFRPKGTVTDADFVAAKERYPIGTRTVVTIRQLAPGNAAIVQLDGTVCDGFLKGRSDAFYNAGDRVAVRVLRYDAKRKSITLEATL